MAKLNISQAARAVGVSRKTMQTHIKKGKVSTELNRDGNKVIDVAELVRVYGEVHTEDDAPTEKGNSEKDIQSYALGVMPLFEEKISMLQEKIELLEQDRQERRQREEELKQEKQQLLEMLETEQEKTKTLLLTYQPQEQQSKRGFWARVLGK